jgi:hypothetical protein
MINCTIPIVEVDMQDCVGDTVGKINYNSLALDTTVCNLSSLFYTNDVNVIDAVNNIFYLLSSYSEFNLFETYNTEYKNNIKIAATTVNLLSSFWGSYQFSVQMPINAISLSANDIAVISPKLSSTDNPVDVYNLVNNRLKILSQSYLNNNYRVEKYPTGTIINVCFFLYNITPAIKDPNSNNLDPLVKVKYTPTASFNQNLRTISAKYNRDTVFISTGVVLRFIANNEKWNYIGYYLNDKTSTAEPNHNNIAIYPENLDTQKLASESTTNLGSCNTIKENKWYSLKEYVYGNALYAGTQEKLGKITLTIRTPDNRTSSFSYKANGYSPTTNTGGTDVYLEVNNNIINAYEEYPITKTLVKSWVNPYVDVEGTNFKFRFDRNGVSYNVCGSKSLI